MTIQGPIDVTIDTLRSLVMETYDGEFGLLMLDIASELVSTYGYVDKDGVASWTTA